MGNPLVSILSITYNHEKFIAQAIETWLMQKTDFEYEIVIGEDCSTDNTLKIIREYQAKHPGLIRLITSDHNVGMQANFLRTLKACRGKYIALCEGDDYWTDPNKLQKQVEFLEKNGDYAICFHPVVVVNEDNNKLYVTNESTSNDTELKDLIRKNYLFTSSVVFRKINFDIPEWLIKAPIGDWPLHLLNARYGKIRMLDEVMSVYRLHSGGVYSTKKKWDIEKDIIFQQGMVFLYERLIEEFKHNKEFVRELEIKLVSSLNSLRINYVLTGKICKSKSIAHEILLRLKYKSFFSKLFFSVFIHYLFPFKYSKYLSNKYK